MLMEMIEILRLNITEMMRVKPAADAGDHRAEYKSGDLERAHVEPHEVGDALVVVHGGDGDSKPSGKQKAYE